MAFEVLIKPAVYNDIDEAVGWYEAQSHGLGKKFLIQFEIAITKIITNPYGYNPYYKNVRRIILDKFPYKIFYTISLNEVISVIGIYHSKRSDSFVKRKME